MPTKKQTALNRAAAEKPKRAMSPAMIAQQGKGLANLTPFTKESAQAARLKGLRTRQAQKKAKEDFVNRVKVYHMIMHKLPTIDAELVIRMRIHMALQEQDFEDAARWAAQLLEYQRPKLARQEVVMDDKYDKLSVEELRKLAQEEGLIPS